MDIVTGAGYRVEKVLGDRNYTLRAPSYDEVGNLVVAALGRQRPGPAIINDVLRQALARVERPDLIPVVDEAEDAADDHQALHMQRKDDQDQSAILGATRRLLIANRALSKAEWAARDDPDFIAIKTDDERFARAELADTIALCLVDWSGPGMPEKPEKVTGDFVRAAFAGSDIAALGSVAMALRRPTAEVEKN